MVLLQFFRGVIGFCKGNIKIGIIKMFENILYVIFGFIVIGVILVQIFQVVDL